VLRKRTKHGPIGLDIGASSLKMLQFSEEGTEPTLLAAAHCQLPPLDDNPATRDAAIERAVAQALRQHPFQGRDAVAALACREFQMKSIRLPRMPAEEMASAVGFEAQERFGVTEGGTQIRHIVAGEVRHGNELKEEVIVFATPDDLVQARLKLLETLKLRPLAIDITPCAVARCFFRFLRRAEDVHTVNVFLDVGWRGTSIVLTRGTELSFLKTIDVGGEHFNEAVAKALSISREEAAELRIRIMRDASRQRADDKVTVSGEVRATVTDAVRPLIERISRDVQMCLRYFAVTFRGQRPKSLTLVGGEAHEPSIFQSIGGAIDIPCTIGNPLRGMSLSGNIGGRDQRAFQPAWVVACGLSLRGSRWVRTSGARPESSQLRPAAALGV